MSRNLKEIKKIWMKSKKKQETGVQNFRCGYLLVTVVEITIQRRKFVIF